MNELATILQCHKIDITSLQLLFGEGDERVYGLVVPGSVSVKLWHTLHELVPETGHWPVILGNREEKDQTIEGISRYSATLASSILEGSKLDVLSWFEQRRTEYEEQISSGGEVWLGDWDIDSADYGSFSIPYSREEGEATIYVGLLPTSISWYTLAYLHFGGWNDCPLPEEHVCVMKHWSEKYGAEIVTVLPDIVVMRVIHPPIDREGSLSLAWEHYLYCPDSVNQGAGSLKNLASGLLNGEIWTFWWD